MVHGVGDLAIVPVFISQIIAGDIPSKITSFYSKVGLSAFKLYNIGDVIPYIGGRKMALSIF